MVTKVINIEVRDGDLNQLNTDLNKVEKNIKDVEKQSEKAGNQLKEVGDNGGAIATLDSLTGGLATKIRDAAEASKLFNFSLKGTRTALIATGIGAFVVALGAVVAYWDEIVELITQANAKLESQINANKQNISLLDGELKVLESKEKLLVAEGKNTEAIKKQRLEILNNIKAEQQTLLENLNTKIKNLEASRLELDFSDKLLVNALETVGLYEKAAQVRAKSIIVNQEEISQLKLEALQLEAQINSTSANIITSTNAFNASSGIGGGRTQDTVGAVSGNLSQTQLAQIENAQIVADQIQLIQRKSREQELIEEQALTAQKIALTKQGLDAISNVLGRSSAAGKAVAIASALINTYQGISAELATKTATPFEFGLKLANIASVTAIGFKTVKDIVATKLPSFAGSVGSASAGSQPSAPAFNVVGTSGVNQLAQTLNQDQQPLQAYVVGSNVTTQQELDRNIVDTATIG